MIEVKMNITGYKLTNEIYVGARNVVFQAVREQDQKPVVVKLMRNEYPSFNELVQFRNQYSIAKNLETIGIVKPLSLETHGNGYALIMEDLGEISLKDWLKRKKDLSLNEFFPIALQIVDILSELIDQRVIHKDIKPANILIHPETKQVKLIDFSISSLLPREAQQLQNPNVLEGTLVYISPEQTGRMNRGIDYRSDFYSLGVTFFELLTGQLPFNSDDVMELVHCHLAKQPPFVTSHQAVNNEEIPQVLSDIVIKLMAKNAEDRYQSAAGLKYDLELCAQQWQETGNITPFELATRDICERFIIPEKLYGREKEVETLLAAFERVSGVKETLEAPCPMPNSQTEIMLVAGFSGIGKTAVVNEVHKPIVRQRGYFIKGKFDQFQRNIPLSAFVQAFRDLMGQILGENNTQLQQWKIKIQDTVGENGQIIVDVIPELEEIIGKQPPVTELSGNAAQNRFNLLFLKFIQIFTTKEHPLVIFLDDLQWADSASLKLIQLLMQTDTGYLLIIGAYRDNEVYPTHPLTLTLAEVQKIGAVINTITLAPLAESDLNHLVADTLDCSLEIAVPLTELIYQKTQGNPFFSTQFLKSLYEDKLITYNLSQFPLTKGGSKGGWQCDIAEVRKLALTDDVVEFMALQLQKLPNSTQEVLKLAACIGNQFDVNTLSIVYGKSPAETASDLWKAMQEGLILPTTEIYKFYQQTGNEEVNQQLSNFDKQSAKYKFLHDRVQQAAYSLIPDSKKQITHLKIGQQLLENIAIEEREDKIFEIVNQINIAKELIIKPEKREELAQLNLIAAKKAKASTAYAAAIDYLTTGRQLLTSQCWKTQYQLTLELYEMAAEVGYLGGNFAQMEELIAVVLKQANTLLDKVKVYEVQIQACIAQNQPLEAVKVVLNVVKQLGIKFPQKPTTPQVLLNFIATKAAYLGKPIDSFYDFPEMTSVPKLVTTRLISKALTATYIGFPQLLPLLIFKKVNLYLKYGNNKWSALTYAWYGLILCGVIQDIPSGYKFGELALKLLQKFDAKEIEASVNFVVYTFIKHWKIHVKETLQPFLEAYQSGLNTGDLDYAALNIVIHFQHSYFSGLELSELEQKLALYGEKISQIKQETSLNYQNTLHQLVLNLLGKSEQVCLLKGSAYDAEKMLSVQMNSNDNSGVYLIQLCKGSLSYLFGEYTQAVEHLKFAYPYLEAATALFSLPTFNFYDSLANLAVLSENNSANNNNFLKQVNKNQKQMKKWADNAPMNHLHKYYLVEAEKYRVLDKKTQAINYYDLAIKGAKANEYIHEEALANELAAKFYLQWEKEPIATAYLTQAYYCYARWGAKAKVEDLEKRYPELLASLLNLQKQAINSTETISLSNGTTFHSTNTGASLLDLATVTKASQAISGVLELEHLLNTLIQVVMENAGASKCALLMRQGDNLVVEAIQNFANSQASILNAIPLENCDFLPISLINYVARTHKDLVIFDSQNLSDINQFSFLKNDFYIQSQQTRSILCNPILNQGKLIGILYLENNLTPGAFTKERVSLLNLICSQAAISLENARLYQQAQDYAQQLENSLTELKQAQLKLVQGEKMSALGNLVAGVAHEINNPVGFIAGNLQPATDYVKDVFGLIDLYQKKFPESDEEIDEEIEAIDLDYLREDLPKLISSMEEGVNRIRDISTSLRTFSRADTQHKVAFNIHEGIDSTIMILKHRLKANENQPEIQIIKQYDDLPSIQCFPGQLNQVFMNLLANAIDALEESNLGKSYKEIAENPNIITVLTKINPDNNCISIHIKDNGVGMSEAVKNKIFDHLFTTKAVGKGTGLGMAIAYQIIIEKHGGNIQVDSSPGMGTEFIIQLPINE